MVDIIHRIGIKSPAAKVFKAANIDSRPLVDRGG
jgi:hypothetical protein